MYIGDMFRLRFLRLKVNTDNRQQLCFDNTLYILKVKYNVGTTISKIQYTLANGRFATLLTGLLVFDRKEQSYTPQFIVTY